MFNVTHIDHLVLTVKNINVGIDFHSYLQSMQTVQFNESRSTLKIGKQKINRHEVDNELEHKMPQWARLIYA